MTDGDASQKLANWFTDCWDDPFSLQIASELISLIEESWASEVQPTPYEVYLKVCHALSEVVRVWSRVWMLQGVRWAVTRLCLADRWYQSGTILWWR